MKISLLDMYLSLADHLLPVVITLCVVIVIFLVRIGGPYLHYITLVESAHNPEGVTKLAKYLAYKTGGRGVNVDAAWEKFIPAAEEIHLIYNKRQNTIVKELE